MIKHEEHMFDESFGVAIGLKKPEIPLMEDFQDPKEFEAENEKVSSKSCKLMSVKRMNALAVTLETGEMLDGVTGLISTVV